MKENLPFGQNQITKNDVPYLLTPTLLRCKFRTVLPSRVKQAKD